MENNSIIPFVPAVEAVDCRKIREYNRNQIHNPLVVLIGRLYLLRGQQADQSELLFQSNELEEELIRSYSYLSLEEVRIALDNGVKKRYGDYFGLNVITYLDWLRDYSNSDQRIKAKKESERRKLPPPHVPTPEETEITTIREICLRYKWWESGNKLFYIPSPDNIYEYLTLHKYICVSDTEKNTYFAEAFKYLQKNQPKRGDRSVGEDPRSIGEILSNGITPEVIDKESVIHYAKLFIIEVFFRSVKNSGKDINSVVELKKNIK